MIPTPEEEGNNPPVTEQNTDKGGQQDTTEQEQPAETENQSPAAEPATEATETETQSAETGTTPETETTPQETEPKDEEPETDPKAEKSETESKEKEPEKKDEPKESEAKVEPKKSTAEEMKEMECITVDTAFANSAFDVLGNLSFDKLIGNPIRAAVKVQRDMAKEALNYIKSEGIKVGKDGKGQLAYVTLNFVKDGKKSQMNIPLLTLIPYPSLAISEMTYHFTAKIEASSGVTLAVGTDLPKASASEAKSSKTSGTTTATPAGGGGSNATNNGGSSASNKAVAAANEAIAKAAGSAQSSSGNNTLSASYSSKRDSSATRDSKYSVETTVDVSITATSDKTPDGISKIIEILNSSTEVISAEGELAVSPEQVTLTNGHAVVKASYRTGDGTYKREEIKCSVFGDKGKVPQALANGDEVLFVFSEAGTYVVKAGVFQRVVSVS